MPTRRSDPDRFLEIALNGQATRLAAEGADYSAAVAQLVELADGRGDLLALAAGSILGGYIASPGTRDPRAVRAAAMLIEAGADPDHVSGAFDAARDNITRRSGPLSR